MDSRAGESTGPLERGIDDVTPVSPDNRRSAERARNVDCASLKALGALCRAPPPVTPN